MSIFGKVVGVGALCLNLGTTAIAKEQDFCATQDSIAQHAISILNIGCGEHDEKQDMPSCGVAMIRIVQFLDSCGASANPYLQEINKIIEQN